jgi:hypothetical protein
MGKCANSAYRTIPKRDVETKRLSHKQTRFADLVLKGISPSEAYVIAYETPDPNIISIPALASRLVQNPYIVAYMNRIRAPVVKKLGLDLQEHLEKLEEIRDLAIDKGNFGAAVSSEVSRGKAAGLYIERSESTVRSLNANITVPPDQLKDIAAALLRKI